MKARVLFCIGLTAIFAGAGCVRARPQPQTPPAEAGDLLAEKEEKIRQLEAALAQSEKQLQEKDAIIQELKERLKTFGVF